jgi:hypothetical protein
MAVAVSVRCAKVRPEGDAVFLFEGAELVAVYCRGPCDACLYRRIGVSRLRKRLFGT